MSPIAIKTWWMEVWFSLWSWLPLKNRRKRKRRERRRKKRRWQCRQSRQNRFSTNNNGPSFTIPSNCSVTMPKETKFWWWSTWWLASKRPSIESLKRFSNSDKTKMKSSTIKINESNKLPMSLRKPMRHWRAERTFLRAMIQFLKSPPTKSLSKDTFLNRRERRLREKDWNKRKGWENWHKTILLCALWARWWAGHCSKRKLLFWRWRYSVRNGWISLCKRWASNKSQS